jgi:hypothetical protein
VAGASAAAAGASAAAGAAAAALSPAGMPAIAGAAIDNVITQPAHPNRTRTPVPLSIFYP